MTAVTKNSAILAAVILAAALGGTIVLFVVTPDREDVCSTKGCINAAARVLNSMDTSADPCDDFFQYTCGGWIDAHPLPEDKAFYAVHHKIASVNEEAFREILESDDTDDRDAIKKLKRLYKSCMDEDAIEKLGARPALDLIDRLGGMPLFGDAFDEANFSLAAVKAKSLSSVFVAFGVDTDYNNASRHIVSMYQPSLSISRDYYIDPQFKRNLIAYRKYTEDILTALWKGKDEIKVGSTTYNQTALKNGVDEIIRLETELATVYQPQSEESLTDYIIYPLGEISNKVSAKLNWYEYVEKMMSRVNYTVTPSFEVAFYGAEYLRKILDVVGKYDKRILQNYIMWMEIDGSVKNMPKRFRDILTTYRMTTTGTSREEARWKTCVSAVKSDLEMPLGAIFVERFVSKETKRLAKEMADNVFDYFGRNLKTLSWMDERTKKKALVKIESMGALLAYPDYIIDKEDPRLDEEFADLNISRNDYFTSKLNVNRLAWMKDLKSVSEPVERFDWSGGPAEVNAYYLRHKNVMILPAGYIQAPHFDEHQPYSMNYGSMGRTIGHEVTHGFDVEGSKIDEKGEIKNWWSNYSRKQFEEKAQCVRDQYNGFYYEHAEMFVDGDLTISENIADMGGINLAYGTYKQWRKTSGKTDFKLPGLEHFTHEQLFFISYGMSWCGNDTKADAQNALTWDDHSPNLFRTIGPLMNFKKFGRAFDCKKGVDKMFPLPENTCRVW